MQRQSPYFEALKLAKPPLRRAILKYGDKQLIKCLRQTCIKILRGSIKLQPRQRSVLKKHKTTLYRIARAKPESARRILSNQKGGIVHLLFPTIIRGAASYIGHRATAAKQKRLAEQAAKRKRLPEQKGGVFWMRGVRFGQNIDALRKKLDNLNKSA